MTGRISNNLIEVRQGDSFALNFCIKNGCKPVDLSGAKLLMHVRDDGGNLIFDATGTIVDSLNGRIAILLTPEHTSKPVGDYVTDVQLTTADGSVNTIYPANVNQIAVFRITEQVTTGV